MLLNLATALERVRDDFVTNKVDIDMELLKTTEGLEYLNNFIDFCKEGSISIG
jgi:hypothetical protein